MATLGLPSVIINFKTLAGTAVIRSSRGVVALILNDENYTDEDGLVKFDLSSASDIPSKLSSRNADLIRKCFVGSPNNVFAFVIPPETYTGTATVTTESTVATTTEIETTTTVQSDVEVESTVTVTDPDTGETSEQVSTVTVQSEVTVPTTTTVETTTVVTGTTTSTVTVTATVTANAAYQALANMRVNYIAHPTGGHDDQQALASFVTGQRKNRNKTLKAVVANHAADSYSVINFTTGGIRTVNPEYTSALEAAGGDESLVDETIPQYRNYTATEYTARIAGIAAGIGLDRSMTYYQLPEVLSVNTYADIDAAIDAGELVLFDDGDGLGVRIGRGVNSYVNFSANEGEDLRYIKIVESIDLIHDDIAANFKAAYVGKVANTYENKSLYVSKINTYLNNLRGSVLDTAGDSYVEIDGTANAEYARGKGVDVDSLSDQQLRELKTGTHVFLKGVLSVVNAMEDLQIEFVL